MIYRVIALISLAMLAAGCGGDEAAGNATSSNPASSSPPAASPSTDTAAVEYQEQVRQTVSDSVVNSLVREWNASEQAVRCVLEQVRPSQLAMAGTDPAIRKILEECGVDPSVVR